MRVSVLAFLLGSAALAASECCDRPVFDKDSRLWTCVDGAVKAGVLNCCAYGSCNIFCCNCDDGCRQRRLTQRMRSDFAPWQDGPFGQDTVCGLSQSESQCEMDQFEALDTNRDGKITLAEAWAGIDVLRPQLTLVDIDKETLAKELATLFKAYDTDHDGELTFTEAVTPQALDSQN